MLTEAPKVFFLLSTCPYLIQSRFLLFVNFPACWKASMLPLNAVYESPPQQESIASFEIQMGDINNNGGLCCIARCVFNISNIHVLCTK